MAGRVRGAIETDFLDSFIGWDEQRRRDTIKMLQGADRACKAKDRASVVSSVDKMLGVGVEGVSVEEARAQDQGLNFSDSQEVTA